jgi:hypothetical protein
MQADELRFAQFNAVQSAILQKLEAQEWFHFIYEMKGVNTSVDAVQLYSFYQFQGFRECVQRLVGFDDGMRHLFAQLDKNSP